MIAATCAVQPAMAENMYFDIPAQSVGKALQAFSRQSGYRLLFPAEGVASLRTQSLTGTLAPESALDRLLVGTPLTVASIRGRVVALASRQPARAMPIAHFSGAAPVRLAALQQPGVIADSAEPVVAADEARTPDQDIVVTGTLIRNPAIVSATPVQVTGREEIQLRQANTAEDLLRSLPGVVPSVGSAVNIGNPGFSFVDLRGLGSNRNVVLLDGQRITPADLYGRVDLNNIPLSLIERVENLTGGASTTYGADAVTGVVNFVTKTNFSGVELNASNQITEQGDGNYFRADVTLGGNFADDRGNMVLSVGYQNSKPVYQGARDFSTVAIDSFSGQPAGSSYPNPAAFDLIGRTGGRVQVRPETGTFQNGLYAPFNFNPYNIFQVPFKRYNIYAAGHYDLTDGIEFYTRGLYSKNISRTIIAPSGVTGSNVDIPLSNPFLTASERGVFCADAGFGTAECDAAALATNPRDANYRTVTEALRYRSVDLGARVDNYETEVFDVRGGFRGDITDSIRFDVAGAYGRSVNTHKQDGYQSLSRTRDALLATNTSTCLSGNAGCVPLNIFGGVGSVTDAMAGYIGVPAFSTTRSSLGQVQGQISGDFGLTSPLAAKPVNFAAGASYRKYKASQDGDVGKTTPGELGLDIALTPFSGGYDVVEGFGELIAPLIENRPFFQNLSLETGVRYSRYKVDAPTSPSFNTTTYKAGGNWTPVEGIKLRGMYQHAVRAPNIYELFLPAATGLANLGADPCAGTAPLGNAVLAATCIAQGAPADRIGRISQPASREVNAVSSGNLNLQPEIANSYTLGTVLQPRTLIPGFTLTVDYFHIKIKKAITALSSIDAIDACFDNASASNPACTAIRRNPSTGALDGDPATTPGLALPLTNAGMVLTDGIDLGASYRRDIGPGALGLSFSGTWTRRSKFTPSATAASRECVGYYSTNCGSPAAPEQGSLQPEFVWNQRTSYAIGPVNLSLLWRHLSSMRYEPAVAATTGPAFTGDGNYGRIKAFNYFDGTVLFTVSDQMELTASVQNLGNKKPPLVGYSIGSSLFNSGNTYPSTYDALGRRFAVSARLRY